LEIKVGAREKMKINDIVIYASNHKVCIGRVARFEKYKQKYVIMITPIENGTNVIAREPSEVRSLSVLVQQYKNNIKEKI